MDIGVLASLKATFQDATNWASPRNDHVRGTAANIHSRIHFTGKPVVFLVAVFWWRRRMSAVSSGFVCAKSEFALSKIVKPPPC